MSETIINAETGEVLKGAPPCHACRGVCCSTDSGWRFVQLRQDEMTLPLFKARVVTHPEAGVRGFFFLRNGSGGGYCPYFDLVLRRCKIYEQRPANCREFDCRACQPQGQFFQKNPDVLALIKQHQV